MEKVKIITAEEAAKLVEDNHTITTGGFVGNCLPEALNIAVEKRFLETGHPRDLTYFYPSSQGNRDGKKGADHYAHKGLIKRAIVGHYATAKSLGKMCVNNECEAYNLPQGALVYLMRDIAGKRAGTITHVGLNTFVDPRNGGGKVNERTKEDLVELVKINGEEKLLYKTFPIDIAFIRGTYSDEYGNISLEREVATTEVTSVAQAVKNSGGKVVVQVEGVSKGRNLDPRLVKIPGIYVDYVVVSEPEMHEQTLNMKYNPGLSGEKKVVVGKKSEKMPLNFKKIIARRAAMELEAGAVVNLGVGAPEHISSIADEENTGGLITLTVEAGTIGGIPQGGAGFGSSLNPDAIIDQGYQFDFYDGGGLDLAFLGLAQCDEIGNINVSKFGGFLAGCGGFINITQNAKKVFFCGGFTTKGLKTKVDDGKLIIEEEGKLTKFIKEVEQITFSGKYAKKINQPVLYITERAVFELRQDGMHLIEIAPGIDIQTQIIDLMEFKPIVDEKIKLMDYRIFREENMNLRSYITGGK